MKLNCVMKGNRVDNCNGYASSGKYGCRTFIKIVFKLFFHLVGLKYNQLVLIFCQGRDRD